MQTDLARIMAASGLAPHASAAAIQLTGVSTDSRRLRPGELFVALKGLRFDGHDFVATALAQGAAAVVVDARRWPTHPDAVRVPAERLVAVPDPLAALGAIAAWWRRQWGGRVVAITGSAGKTTTKELIATALREALGAESVWATPGNWNNAIGVPLTLCALEPTHQVAVVEVAMNQPGEIVALGTLAAPEIAIVLNALRAHLAGLGTVEAIAEEKGALVTTLPAEGTAILPCASSFLERWRALAGGRPVVTFGASPDATVRVTAVQQSAAGLTVSVARAGEAVTVTLPRWGRHLAELVAAALALLAHWQIPWHYAASAWANLPAVPGRLQRLVVPSGAVLFDDTYNANPDAMRAAIDLLVSEPRPRRILVMGEMAELGAQSSALHTEVGAYARAQGVEQLFALGGEGAQAAARAFGPGGAAYAELPDLLAQLLPQLDSGCAVLVKGSRVSRMERVVAALLARGADHAA